MTQNHLPHSKVIQLTYKGLQYLDNLFNHFSEFFEEAEQMRQEVVEFQGSYYSFLSLIRERDMDIAEMEEEDYYKNYAIEMSRVVLCDFEVIVERARLAVNPYLRLSDEEVQHYVNFADMEVKANPLMKKIYRRYFKSCKEFLRVSESDFMTYHERHIRTELTEKAETKSYEILLALQKNVHDKIQIRIEHSLRAKYQCHI